MDEQKQIDQIGNEALKLVRQIGTVKINLEKRTEELRPLLVQVFAAFDAGQTVNGVTTKKEWASKVKGCTLRNLEYIVNGRKSQAGSHKERVVVLKPGMKIKFMDRFFLVSQQSGRAVPILTLLKDEPKKDANCAVRIEELQDSCYARSAKKPTASVSKGRKGHVLYGRTGVVHRGSAIRKTVPGVAGHDPWYEIIEDHPAEGPNGMRYGLFISGFETEADRDLVLSRMQLYGKCSHNLTETERAFLNQMRKGSGDRHIDGLGEIWPAAPAQTAPTVHIVNYSSYGGRTTRTYCKKIAYRGNKKKLETVKIEHHDEAKAEAAYAAVTCAECVRLEKEWWARYMAEDEPAQAQ